MFSLKSPHQGDSNEYTLYTIFNIQRKSAEIIPNLQLLDFFQGTQSRVQMVKEPSKSSSDGKRAISVQATEVLLYILISLLLSHVTEISF